MGNPKGIQREMDATKRYTNNQYYIRHSEPQFPHETANRWAFRNIRHDGEGFKHGEFDIIHPLNDFLG
jgi:hypothetical protein